LAPSSGSFGGPRVFAKLDFLGTICFGVLGRVEVKRATLERITLRWIAEFPGRNPTEFSALQTTLIEVILRGAGIVRERPAYGLEPSAEVEALSRAPSRRSQLKGVRTVGRVAGPRDPDMIEATLDGVAARVTDLTRRGDPVALVQAVFSIVVWILVGALVGRLTFVEELITVRLAHAHVVGIVLQTDLTVLDLSALIADGAIRIIKTYERLVLQFGSVATYR
jgi:tetrahydromethanopterin S-methyltransferase subunit C